MRRVPYPPRGGALPVCSGGVPVLGAETQWTPARKSELRQAVFATGMM